MEKWKCLLGGMGVLPDKNGNNTSGHLNDSSAGISGLFRYADWHINGHIAMAAAHVNTIADGVHSVHSQWQKTCANYMEPNKSRNFYRKCASF